MTLDGDLDIGSVYGASLTITNGLTLNGTATSGGSGQPYNSMKFRGSQTLDGAGTVIFGNSYNPTMILSLGGTTLTIGPGITIHGGTSVNGLPAYIGRNYNSGTPYNVTLINQGTIQADVSGAAITVDCQSFTNYGNVQALNGSTLNSTVPSAKSSSTGIIRASV